MLMISEKRINYLFITAILITYLFTRIHDIYILTHMFPVIQHSIMPTDLSFAKLVTGISWFNNNVWNIHSLQVLNQNGNHEFFLGKVSGYGNALSTLLCLVWVVCLTIKSKSTIKSTQILLLGYMVFACVSDFFAYRLSILLGNPHSYVISNCVMLAGIFVLAHSCEIIRELTYSRETVNLIKRDLCLILLLSFVMIVLAFLFNAPLAAYSLILLLHLYSSFTVSKRKIYQNRAAAFIKTATVFYILLDTGTMVFYLNSTAIWIKVLAYMLVYFLYTLAHVLFILSEYSANRKEPTQQYLSV
jgi:hypothetical protein